VSVSMWGERVSAILKALRRVENESVQRSETPPFRRNSTPGKRSGNSIKKAGRLKRFSSSSCLC